MTSSAADASAAATLPRSLPSMSEPSQVVVLLAAVAPLASSLPPQQRLREFRSIKADKAAARGPQTALQVATCGPQEPLLLLKIDPTPHVNLTVTSKRGRKRLNSRSEKEHSFTNVTFGSRESFRTRQQR